MILNNYYNCLKTLFAGKTLSGLNLTRPNGTNYNCGINTNYYGVNLRMGGKDLVTTMYSVGIVLGTGTTAPTVNDYCLSGGVITTVTGSVADMSPDDGTSIISVLTITNTADTAITIGEIATTCYLPYESSRNDYFMVDRTVLEAPVTIEAGGVGQITYTIEMPFPV